jgi:FtsH-binding integral membrane protein
MAWNDMNADAVAGTAATTADSARVATFLRAVYGWMFVGLAVTAAVAFYVASSPTILSAIAGNRLLFWVVLLAPLGLVLWLSARVATLAPTTAAALFLVYSGLTGIMFAFILLAYTGQSVASVFLVTSGMFGGLALYGTVTKRDLSGVGQFAMMGLIGVVIAGIVSIFWQNDMLQFVMSVCGVIVFTGLTAYDANRLRAMALQLPAGQTGSYAIVGALRLYLDFINLFLFLLRLFGRRR